MGDEKNQIAAARTITTHRFWKLRLVRRFSSGRAAERVSARLPRAAGGTRRASCRFAAPAWRIERRADFARHAFAALAVIAQHADLDELEALQRMSISFRTAGVSPVLPIMITGCRWCAFARRRAVQRTLVHSDGASLAFMRMGESRGKDWIRSTSPTRLREAGARGSACARAPPTSWTRSRSATGC